MTNRTRLLTAVAALALPAALAGAQTPTPTGPAPPAAGTPPVAQPNSSLPPAPDTTDRVTDPVTEPPQEPTQATDPAAPTPDAEAEAAAEQQAQAQVREQPMPPAQAPAAQTQATTQAQTAAPPAQAPAAQVQTTVQTQTGVPTPAGQVSAATVADVRTGVQVRDTTGGLVGTIESVDSAGAVVSTGAARAKIPVASFGRNNQGLVISMTKSQLEAAVAAAAQSQPPTS